MMGTKSHIMVVDDEAPMQGLLKDFLESQGYQVSCYSSVGTVLKILQGGSQVDAIVSDVRMSPISGLELLRMVKKDYPALPVLLFTAAGSTEECAQSLKMGAARYFIKPFPLTALKSSLQGLLVKKD